ncbi:hypothetical protein [Paraburkholderia sp. C35]|uniref:hypothetical protein n=1 Tax=Paraburkholderia sp. C35 TaxID=2126993 RepID=UPI000D68DA2C|nr:hypothetical protein [Paraburkholderia sp. C35]
MAELSEKEKRQAAAREAAREKRILEFADGANARPASVAPVIAPVPAAAPIPEPAAPADAEKAAESPAEAAAAPAEPQAVADTPQAAGEAASAPAAPAADAEAPAAAPKPASKGKKGKDAGLPWADAHPRVKVNFSTQFSEEQHMKLTWLTENMTGRQSIQKLVHEAVDALLDKRIKEILKS